MAIITIINLIIEISQGLAVFIGGILSQIDFSISYITAIIVGMISLIISLNFKEVYIREDFEERVTIINHLKKSINILKDNKKLLNVTIFFPIIYKLCVFLMKERGQNILERREKIHYGNICKYR